MGLIDIPYVGGVGQKKKLQPTFYTRVKLWRHSDVRMWIPFFWILTVS